MARIAILTMCRDRLIYTKQAIGSLHKNAGLSYDHFIIDNGSTDETENWLDENSKLFKKVIKNKKNLGLHKSFQLFMDSAGSYDYLMKIDNDCLILCEDLLKELVNISKSLNDSFILSPRIEGIFNQPERIGFFNTATHRLGVVNNMGGIAMFIPKKLLQGFHINPNGIKYKGLDSAICAFVKDKFGIAYVEDMSVMHIENSLGQERRFKQYFSDKKL